MKKYEVMIVAKPNLGEDTYQGLIQDCEKWISNNEGVVVETQALKQRTIPTPFNKKHDSGYFILCIFDGNNTTIDQVSHHLRITENVLRYMVSNYIEPLAEEEDQRGETQKVSN